jgi:hypothetical protein
MTDDEYCTDTECIDYLEDRAATITDRRTGRTRWKIVEAGSVAAEWYGDSLRAAVTSAITRFGGGDADAS